MGSLIRLSEGAERGALLICFPYAGGSSAIYHSLARELPDLDVWSVEYPGRGTRWDEALVYDLHELARGATAALAELVDRPALLLGYSMGAVVAFEVAGLVEPRTRDRLAALVVAAAAAPHRQGEPVERAADMDDARFLDHVIELGGTPEALRHDAELLELFLPILRADFTAAERYRCRAEAPLALRIVAFSGRGDETVAPGDVEAWAHWTAREFNHQAIEGDHFFLNDARSSFASVLTSALRTALEAPTP